MGAGDSSKTDAKITQRDVFVGAVSIIVAAISAGLFAHSCSADADGPPSTQRPEAETSSPSPESPDEAADLEFPPNESGDTDDSLGRELTGEEVYLADLNAVSGKPFTDVLNLAGTDFVNSIRTDSACDGDEVFSYALEGKWRTFEATVGVTADAHASQVFQLRVYVDDVQVGPRYDLTKFDTEPVTVDVTGAVELSLRAQHEGQLCAEGQTGWGDARLSR